MTMLQVAIVVGMALWAVALPVIGLVRGRRKVRTYSEYKTVDDDIISTRLGMMDAHHVADAGD
jgi:multisubunit Na+/H+ antiporter MnhC subunit